MVSQRVLHHEQKQRLKDLFFVFQLPVTCIPAVLYSIQNAHFYAMHTPGNVKTIIKIEKIKKRIVFFRQGFVLVGEEQSYCSQEEKKNDAQRRNDQRSAYNIHHCQ